MYSKVHHELAILSIAPSWAGSLRIAYHELAIHKELNGDAAECCGLQSDGMWYLTAEWSGEPSGDLSGDLVAVRAARKGTSGERVTESAE